MPSGSPTSVRTARCLCGEVEIELAGAPILAATCHCDDCQAGSQMIEALPGSPTVLDAAAGTAYVHYRKDRIRILRGADRLRALKLNPTSPTNRMVTTCCNSAMLVTFDNALHWNPVYRGRLGADAPPVEMRVNTRFVPAGTTVPDDVPSYRGFPFSFVWRLLKARLAMALGR